MPLTADDIQRRVNAIAIIAGDPESAHISEDELHVDVLRAIADGAPDAAELAKAALHTLTLGFSRWYA
jgi:hypothetical protein